MSEETTVIHWFRRDLRLDDNTALNAALKSGGQVAGVFVLDDAILTSPRLGLPRLALMLKALAALDEALRARGSRLLVRRGSPTQIMPQFVAALDAQALYFNRDYTPFALRRDDAMIQALSVPVHAFDDVVLHAPGAIVKADSSPYTVYTPFRNSWTKAAKPPVQPLAPGAFHPLDGIDTPPIPTLSDLGFAATIETPDGSPAHALRRLHDFTAAPIFEYAETRNRLIPNPFPNAPPGTSYLSPYLRLGMLSPRQAYHAAMEAHRRAVHPSERHSVETWVSELAWRDFYLHILYHFPHADRDHYRREFSAVQFRHAPDELSAWQAGLTGYPVVDAAMRQLAGIGWMHNRARMIVASFLTKDLLIDWREGERHFHNWLMDGDPAANNGGWQWAAGTGTDAQPYFRIFNPTTQGEKFDPDGVYIRHWLPELRNVPTKFIHTPHLAPEPPKDYPPPIVDHAFARARTLQAYSATKSSPARDDEHAR